MNYIDVLWYELKSEAEYDIAIAIKINNAVEKLGLDEQLILPVSARQALMAKIKTDTDLLEKSRLASLSLIYRIIFCLVDVIY
jgi:hypothetical protein